MMSNIIKKYQGIGSHLLTASNYFAVFGDVNKNDDLIVLGNLKEKVSPLLYKNKIKENYSKSMCAELLINVQKLTQSSAYTLISLSQKDVWLLKKEIVRINATHLRLHNHDGNLRISIFDIRRFNEVGRIKRKVNHNTTYMDFYQPTTTEYSCTIFASSFIKLKDEDYRVRINTNDICQFESSNDDVKYLMRNQKIVEPMTVFHSNLLNLDICFVFHPKTFDLTQDTNQFLDLESQ